MHIANSALPPTRQETAHATPSPQLVKAANAFEANFLGELLKPLREGPLFGNGSGLGGDSLGSEDQGGSMGTISSLASQALADAIAKQGGLGIAKMVLAQLAPVEETASQTAAARIGPKCGDCAPQLTMGPEAASALESGSVEMLGQGNLPTPGSNAPTRSAADKSVRDDVSRERRGGLHPMKAVPAIGSVRR